MRTGCSRRCSARSWPAAVRGRAARLGAERDPDRHAGRPDRDGRLPQHPAPPVAAAADHAADRDRAGGHRRCTSTASTASGQLLVLSQVVLSLQLPFAVVPLVLFTADRAEMGAFVAPRWTMASGVARRGPHRRSECLAALADIRGIVHSTCFEARAIQSPMHKRSRSPSIHSDADCAVLSHVQGSRAPHGGAGCRGGTSPACGCGATSTSSKLRESEEIQDDREYLGQLCVGHGAAWFRGPRATGDGLPVHLKPRERRRRRSPWT